MADDGATAAISPELWAEIASRTRDMSSISRIGQTCKASFKGVMESPVLWESLEKYGIKKSANAAEARENFAEYTKECLRLRLARKRAYANDRDVLKRELSEFGACREQPRLGKPLQQALQTVGKIPDKYHEGLTALCREPHTDFFSEFQLRPGLSSRVSPQMAMASVCAVYAAVCKTMEILVLVRANGADDDAKTLSDIFAMDKCIRDLLPAKWRDAPTMFKISARTGILCGTNTILRNSSRICLWSMTDPSPLHEKFDGIIVCAKYLRGLPECMRAPGYALPKFRVHFG